MVRLEIKEFQALRPRSSLFCGVGCRDVWGRGAYVYVFAVNKERTATGRSGFLSHIRRCKYSEGQAP